MAAFAAVLRPEDCVSADPGRGPELLGIAEVVGFVTAKLVGLVVFGFGIPCTVLIFCY
jgi:hypothetical protein